jgi:PKD repeat protein
VICDPAADPECALFEGGGLGTVQGSHTYGDDQPAPYIVTLLVTDKDGDSGSDTFTVTVNNVPPTVTAAPSTFVHTQNQTRVVATFTDPGTGDTHTNANTTIDWADGNGPTSAGVTAIGGQVSGTHTFSGLSGTFPQSVIIRVRVTDDDGGFHEIASVVTVVELQILNIVANPVTGDEGVQVTFTGSNDPVSNPNPSGPVPGGLIIQYLWDFGDGNTGTGSTVNHTYTDNGTYNVRFTVEASDANGLVTAGEVFTTATISNRNPVVTPDADKNISEGGSISVNSTTFSDIGALDTHIAAIDWGDGSAEAGVVNQTANTVSGGPHVYTDNGTYTVTVTVTDNDGCSGSGSFTTTVNSIAPTANIGNTGPVNEGSSVTVSLAGPSDPSGVDTAAGFRYSFDCGSTPLESSYANSSNSPFIDCLFDNDRTAIVAARIIDKDDSHSDYTSLVTVVNVAPSINIVGLVNVNEGDSATYTFTVTDPGADGFAVTAGFPSCGVEGVLLSSTVNTSGGSFDCSFPDGPATVVVEIQVTDSFPDLGIATLSVNVQNAPPTLEIGFDTALNVPSGDTVDEGSVYTLHLSSADIGTDSISSWDIDWGDGTLVQTVPGNPASIIHTFADGLLIAVNNVLPVVNAGADKSINEGGNLEILPLTTFTDAGDNDTHTATIDWGDGSPVESGTISGGSITFGTHFYADNGAFNVIVCVTDVPSPTDVSALVSTCDTVAVIVTNVAPDVADVDPQTVNVPDVVLVSTTFTDAGINDTHTATID